VCPLKVKEKEKVKASHTRCRALGLELICRQPAVIHAPGGRLPLLFARPAVTFPAAGHHRPLAGTKLYCLVTEAHRHIDVNNFTLAYLVGVLCGHTAHQIVYCWQP